MRQNSWMNVRVIKVNLMLFELLTGLRVNFHKSVLGGVNLNPSWLEIAERVLNCK